MTRWRNGTVPRFVRRRYALHLIVFTNDPEAKLSTAYGPACGRAYPLSDRFPDDMRQLAQTFSGPANGPALYVTMFTEFETFPCKDSAWNPDTETTNYYRALKDRYKLAYSIFHRYAPNASVSIGWGGWQAGYDNPTVGAGPVALPALRGPSCGMSDFQSFQAMENAGNVNDIKAMVNILGKFGPVMLAHYKPNNSNQATFDADMHAVLTDSFLTLATAAGLFALSFMDGVNLAPASSFAFIASAVAATPRAVSGHPRHTRPDRGWRPAGAGPSRRPARPVPVRPQPPAPVGHVGRERPRHALAGPARSCDRSRRDPPGPGTARWGTAERLRPRVPTTVGEWPSRPAAIWPQPGAGAWPAVRRPGRRVRGAALSIHTPISPAATEAAEARPNRARLIPSSTHCATDGTPLALTTKSMYQPGGARLGLLVTCRPMSLPLTVIGSST